jgi:diguanylate cyclase (GGDEF)-like protein
MTQLSLFFLGQIKLLLDGKNITEAFRTKKERAILAYLANEPNRPFRREFIAELFWPNRPEGYARTNLRQALLGIRRALSVDEGLLSCLHITDAVVQFNKHDTWLDTVEFMQLNRAVMVHHHPNPYACESCAQKLSQMIDLYRGPFLEDLILSDSHGYQEWNILHSEQYFRLMLNTLHTLSNYFQGSGDYDQAYKYTWKYINLAPMEEAAHRQMMYLLAQFGRRSAALEQYFICKQILKDELGIEPSRETQQLYEQIRSGEPIVYRNQEADAVSGLSPPESLLNINHNVSTQPLYDLVTKLPGRELFNDRLGHAIIRMKRSREMAAVLLFHLDHVNGIFESQQQAANQMVKDVAGLIETLLRKSDTVARWQPDQFAIILENVSGPEVVEQVAGKLLKGLEEVLQPEPGEESFFEQISGSIGASIFPLDSLEPQVLLELADIAARGARLQRGRFFRIPH